MLKKAMERQMNPVVNGVCDAVCLQFGKDTVPQQTVKIVFKVLAARQSHTRMPPPREFTQCYRKGR